MPRRISLLSLLACSCLAAVLPSTGFAADPGSTNGPSVYAIPFKGPGQVADLVAAGIDILARTPDGKLHVTATPEQRSILDRWPGPVELLSGPETPPYLEAIDANLGDYRTYDEAHAVFLNLVATYPTLAALSSIGQTHELRDIEVLKISDNVATDEDEPEVLISGCHHARELMSVEMPLQFAEYLLANYGSDAQVTQLVDTREIWILPILNPDGYVYVQNNHAGDPGTWWRKNRRNNGDGTYGVDLNRNYAYNWGYDDVGSSPTTSSPVYRGPAPFSEPETQAMRDFCNSRHFVIWLSYHSYSNLLLFPWGYDFDYTADHELFLRLGEDLGDGTGYLLGNTAMGAIYRTNGGSDDWAYGDTSQRPAIYGFTPEVGSYADGGFAPAESFIPIYFNLLLPMNLKCLDLAGNPEKVLGPVPPTLETVYAQGANDLVLTWSDNLPSDPNPAASYEVRGFQMLPPQALDAEGASPWVDLAGGFVPTTSRAASGSGSYFSGYDNNLSASATCAMPYRVTPSTQTFSCMMWYDIELDWDYAYVEVSDDGGIVWQSVPGNITTNSNPHDANRGNGITGASGGWVLASFSLADYLGQEVLLRIHYVTDGSVLGEGLYVDLLDPVPAFDSIQSLGTGITGTSVQFTPAALGTWMYQVRGLDADGDWSHWSPGFDVQVDDPSDAQALPPALSALARNVPNPFNPQTTLFFTIGGRDGTPHAVELAIYDAAGRRLTTLVQGMLPPGNHRAPWDGTSLSGTRLPSGTYLARLVVDGTVVGARKLVLLQ